MVLDTCSLTSRFAVNTAQNWKYQCSPEKTPAPAEFIYYFSYNSFNKILGDSLSIVDLYLKQFDLKSCNVFVSNVFISTDREIWQLLDDHSLLTSIPAWADPNVCLRETSYDNYPDPDRWDRIVLITNKSKVSNAPLKKQLQNTKAFVSNYFIGAKHQDLPSRFELVNEMNYNLDYNFISSHIFNSVVDGR